MALAHTQACFSPSGDSFCVGTADGRLRCYDSSELPCLCACSSSCIPIALPSMQPACTHTHARTRSPAGTGRLRATLGEASKDASTSGLANGHLAERHTCLAWAQTGGSKQVCSCLRVASPRSHSTCVPSISSSIHQHACTQTHTRAIINTAGKEEEGCNTAACGHRCWRRQGVQHAAGGAVVAQLQLH